MLYSCYASSAMMSLSILKLLCSQMRIVLLCTNCCLLEFKLAVAMPFGLPVVYELMIKPRLSYFFATDVIPGKSVLRTNCLVQWILYFCILCYIISVFYSKNYSMPFFSARNLFVFREVIFHIHFNIIITMISFRF